ncbi:MAG: type II toxin-antitoxin system PemK/MazF family toxin [Candidatus Sulfotelmatobacter sp.]
MVTSRRKEAWLIALDPTLGSEIKKNRPCLVLSRDEMNGGLQTLLVAPNDDDSAQLSNPRESHLQE